LGQKRKKLLKIEKEFRDDHQVKLSVELDTDTFEKAKHRAARQIAKRIKIPGFRPGKAPYGVILRQVGEGQVVEGALELVIEEQYSEIIKEAEIDPYGPGTLENVPELDPPTLEFIVPLDSTVELYDYKSISFPYKPPETTDNDVQEALERIQEQHATREKVDRPAETGDVVFMQVSGVRMDVDGEDDATIVEERFSSSVIQENEREDEFPFPGFSKELVGLSADDQKIISYQYPQDHKDESLQGAKAEFKVNVTNVQAQTLPELDDAFAEKASEFDTLDAWKEDLKKNLEEQAQSTYAEEYDDQIVDHIVSESTIKYPPQMIENEKSEILRGLEYRLSQQGITKDLYLKIRGMDEDALFEELIPVAEDRVKRALVLFEIAKAEEINPDPGMVQAEMVRTVDAISSSMTPNEAKKFTKSTYIPNLINNIAADLTTRTTMDYLRATAKGEPWPPVTDEPVDENSQEESAEIIQADVEPIDKDVETHQEAEAVDEEETPEIPETVEVVEDEAKTGAEETETQSVNETQTSEAE
jgi:trigger factor